MRAKSYACLVLAAALWTALANAALAKHTSAAAEENVAVVLGEAGEKYPIYGAGGIKVSGGHHGFWSSNIKSSAIEIDGSGISPQKLTPFNEETDFVAVANGAYFVSNSAVCTLSTAVGGAGQEIVVCTTGKDAKVTYHTVLGQNLIGGDQPGTGRVDKFISDGKDWYRE